MLWNIVFILPFIFISVISTETFQDSEEIQFDEFLNLFENCTVNLYNYKGLTLWITKTPVIIHTETYFRIEHSFTNQAQIPDNCIAAIYILPTSTNASEYIESEYDNDNYYRLPKINTELRYDILLTNDQQNMTNRWKDEYFYLQITDHKSNGLILQTTNSLKPNSLSIENTFEIVNQFHVKPFWPLVTKTLDLKPIVSKRKRKCLDQAVANVNDFSTNKDVVWSLKYDMPNFPHDMPIDEKIKQLNHQNFNGERIQEILQGGFMPSPTEGVNFIARYGKGAENYIIALTALGADIKLEGAHEYRKFRPRITFDVPYGPLMTEQVRRELGFVTCSKHGGPKYKLYTFLEVVKNLLAIFEAKVYYAAILSYLLPAVLLGAMYHGLLKKRIKKEYWITLHPFTWGLRSLIRQAGNRKFNSSRFGWTAFMVTPWLLVAVILSYVFRSHVLSALGPSGRLIYPRNPIKAMHDSGVTLATNNYRVSEFVPQIIRRRIDWQLHYDLEQNSNMAFIGWMDEVQKISDGIGLGCRNPWGPAKIGYTSSWDFYFLSGRYMYGLEDTLVSGWMISNWVDNRILARLKALEGPSGIVAKWREVLKSVGLNGHWHNFRSVGFVNRIGFMGNILYLFYCGAGALALALLVYVVEWVFYLVYTKPRNKWKREMELVRKKMGSEQMQVVCDSARGSVSSSELIGDELIDQPLENEDEEAGKLGLERNFTIENKNHLNQGETDVEKGNLDYECQSMAIRTISELIESSGNIVVTEAQASENYAEKNCIPGDAC